MSFLPIYPFLLMLFVIIIPLWKIVKKTGHHGALSLLFIIPLLNIIMLYFLAFSVWPIERGLKEEKSKKQSKDSTDSLPQSKIETKDSIDLLPQYINCKFCGNKVELEDYERSIKIFKCPYCFKEVDMKEV